MQLTVFGSLLLLLGLLEPVVNVQGKKVVMLVQRQLRRTALPWARHIHLKKSAYLGKDLHVRFPQGRFKAPHYSRPPPFPHGGDDFDQGHEDVNHHLIPHGKGYSHAVTFGQGYIPYDSVKTSFPSGGEDTSGAASSISSLLADQPRSPLEGQLTSSEDSSSYYSDANEETPDYAPDRRGDKYSRSIDKDVPYQSSTYFDNAGNGEPSPNYPSFKEGAVLTPRGIPLATIGGSKDGIVLRDSISLDEYHQRVAELTRNWPQAFPGQQSFQGTPTGVNPQSHVVGSSIQVQGYPGGNQWTSNLAPTAYSVKEETAESSHDFRASPLQSSLQGFPGGITHMAGFQPIFQG